MIISHRNRYLFLEIPYTGSTAINHELRENYDGEAILKKHSFYSDFLKIAPPREKNYFVFAAVRNPLDEAVTHYFKLKTNHKGKYTDPDKLRKYRRIRNSRILRMFEDIRATDLSFQDFFMKYYTVPYSNFACLIPSRYDYLIRFENLQEDFTQVLQILGLQEKRPLPVRNPTKDRKRDFLSYYSPALIPRAKRVFGPFMEQWGYEFPPEWGGHKLNWWAKREYKFVSRMRIIKWKYLRFLP